MTIAQQLQCIEAGLRQWAQVNKATTRIASDPNDVWTALITKPGGAVAYILWQDETKQGEYEELGMVERTFLVIISRGRGLTLDPSTNLLVGSAGGPALFEVIEQARQSIRALEFEADTFPDEGGNPTREPTNAEIVPDYQGARPWRGRADLPLDAYELEFTLWTQLPSPA